MKQLKIFGEIESWLPVQVSDFLESLDKDEEFEVLISSPGGNAFAGISAYHLLKEYQPQVRVLGHASSAASVLMMCAGKGKLLAEEGSLSLLHGASGISIGNADDQRKTADALDKITGSAKKVYMTRFNGTPKELDAILKEDTFHDAEQLLKWGLIDKIIEDKEDESIPAELLEEANIWMQDIKNILATPTSYVANYVTMLDKTDHRPIETNIINNQNEVDMSVNADMQSQFNEVNLKNASLTAQLEVKEQKLAEIHAQMSALNDNVATMTAEKQDLEAKLTAITTELDEAKVSLSEVAKDKVNNDIEAFLNANEKKFVPAQRQGFKMMLESAMNVSEEQFTLAKKTIEDMPIAGAYNTTNDSNRAEDDKVVMTADMALETDWTKVDMFTQEGEEKFNNAVTAVMKANPSMSYEEVCNKLMEAK